MPCIRKSVPVTVLDPASLFDDEKPLRFPNGAQGASQPGSKGDNSVTGVNQGGSNNASASSTGGSDEEDQAAGSDAPGTTQGTSASGALKHGQALLHHQKRPKYFNSHSGPALGLLTRQGAVLQAVKAPKFDPALMDYWASLPYDQRRKLMRVSKKDLFQRIRSSYCSGCYGLFQLRYEELKSCLCSDCPHCKASYGGLVVADDGAITLHQQLIQGDPFELFASGHQRERERELLFMTGAHGAWC